MNHMSEEINDKLPLRPEDKNTALFANLVLQQMNMALMFLGKTGHPESGQPMMDLESAELIIDQLEMLKIKTKGNLEAREEHLLQQSLTNLRMAFVEAVDAAPTGPAMQPPTPTPAAGPGGETKTVNSDAAAQNEEESRIKYSKKY